MAKRGELHAGTSGWSYSDWKGPFYPDDLPSKEFLGFYADRFNSAEINNSFYQLPEPDTLQAWKQQAGSQFTFAVKASRYITHMKKLKDPCGPVNTFLDRMSMLGERLGPVLFQLPPRWRVNVQRLVAFLSELPAGYRYAFEFRDASWFVQEVYDALEDHGAAFCIYDLHGETSPGPITADFTYVRLHGPAEAYQGDYDATQLSGWAGAFSTWTRQKGLDVYCYFNNDQHGYAVKNALRLQEMLS